MVSPFLRFILAFRYLFLGRLSPFSSPFSLIFPPTTVGLTNGRNDRGETSDGRLSCR